MAAAGARVSVLNREREIVDGIGDRGLEHPPPRHLFHAARPLEETGGELRRGATVLDAQSSSSSSGNRRVMLTALSSSRPANSTNSRGSEVQSITMTISSLEMMRAS